MAADGCAWWGSEAPIFIRLKYYLSSIDYSLICKISYDHRPWVCPNNRYQVIAILLQSDERILMPFGTALRFPPRNLSNLNFSISNRVLLFPLCEAYR